MRNILKAEHIKLNHTFGKKLTVLGPLLTFLMTMFLTVRAGISWSFYACVWNWWYVMLMPAMLTVFCYCMIKKEKRNKYYHILSLPIPPEKGWLGKIIYCALTLSASNLIVFLGTAVVSASFGIGISSLNGFFGALILSISGLWMIPLLLFLGARFGMFTCMFIGMFLYAFGTGSFADTEFWWIFPASIPMRLMCPVLGILPNGLPVPEGSVLSDGNVILPGLLISVLWFVGMTILTTRWFQRKGVE